MRRSPEEWAAKTPSFNLLHFAQWRLDVFRRIRDGDEAPMSPEQAAWYRRETRAYLVEALRRGVPLREACI